MTSPPDTVGPTEKNDPSAIDWDELKGRMREAMRAVIRERADELSLSWNDYLDRLQDRERHQDKGDGPPP